ncbi:VCBS repeat-containing protein [Streptomyces sp. DH24]|uniref:FG-GAP repeat domain-containing protein n=1 Tax=Streptomyces sp. DH24 TaxID=3040123 RepID=UPI002441C644|nr:VCBS repeat-containing protein [Streptomyces sp. DH24]MDG9718480.1 VCBS repeat-containing protein [Streptomyces sp. DH24]
MGRHAPRRGGLTAAVSSLVVAVAAASVVLTQDGTPARAATTATTATATATTGITLTDPASTYPRTTRPYVAGQTGYLHRQHGVPGMLWTDYADGTTVTVRTSAGVYTPGTGCTVIGSECRTAWYGSGTDLVALPPSNPATSVTLWDPVSDELTTVATEDKYSYYRALAGRTVVTSHALIDYPDGQRRVRPITGDWANIQDKEIVAADSGSVLFLRGGVLHHIDLATTVNTEALSEVPSAARFVLSEDRFGWYHAGSGTLHLKSRSDPAGPVQVVTVPYQAALDGAPLLTGDRLLLPRDTSSGTVLTELSLTDGTTRELLPKAGAYLVPAPGGDALAVGGTGATDWWFQRVDGDTATAEKAHQIPAMENAKKGLALSRGSLRVAEDNPGSTMDTTSVRALTTDGGATLTASAATEGDSVMAVCPYPGTDCSALWGNSGAAPKDVHLDTFYGGGDGGSGLTEEDRLVALGDAWSSHTLHFGTEGGHIVDVSDGWAVYNSGGASPTQYVGEFGYGQQLKRSVRAAALNGSTLWSATTTAGSLTSYSLTQKKTLATVTVPNLSCVPSELQAAGRWLYWACGTSSAGVYDTRAGTSRAVTPGDVLLGDGFTVRHDHAGARLVLTDAATGATRVVASRLADSGLAVDRRYRWTVDEYTGLVAWFDEYERTRVATTGVAPSAPTVFRSETVSLVEPSTSTPWTGDWQLSRPVTSWSLTFTSEQSGATGRATRTLTGGATWGGVSASWNGRTSGGTHFPNGEFTWTLKATGLGTATPATAATGKGYVLRGSAVRHDFVSADGPDGRGDLLTLNSSGGLTYQHGTGKGTFSGKTTGTGWATSVKAVPFGDLSGDRCNDVLVRLSSGALRLYKPGCNAAVKPTTSYTTLASSGWTQYDQLTSPGDISGDGRPDLITRNASTGSVYLHKGTSTGTLSARVKLYDNWKGYKKIVGVGDITGDGIGDLLAQDTANTLYRYNGKGDGTFAARAKVFSDWGGSYNAVVGVGDITDDGRPDLVSRDSSGNVWRNSGDGKGSFGSRTRIATGWSGYKSLS